MSAAEEYEAAKLEFARVLRFREGEPAKYIAVNRRLDDAVRALIAEAWKCGQLAPQILAEVDQRKLTFAAGLLPKEDKSE